MRAGCLQIGGQLVEQLLVQHLGLRVVDRAGPLDVLVQGLTDIDEPHQFQALLPGGEFRINGVENPHVGPLGLAKLLEKRVELSEFPPTFAVFRILLEALVQPLGRRSQLRFGFLQVVGGQGDELALGRTGGGSQRRLLFTSEGVTC